MDSNSRESKIKLSGFNNLTKILSFNLYDFCITLNDKQKLEYVNYIHDRYNAQKLVNISEEICKIIEANILGVSKQDYDPVGASAMILMSDIKGGGGNAETSACGCGGSCGARVDMHLDKSHITTHTYPDAGDAFGICSFRVDIDIATCGEIVPLNAINYLFAVFECDVVIIDYVVRGYTRLTNGKKIYNDHTVHSIKEFIRPDIIKNYKVCADISLPNDNIWQTKLLIRDDFSPDRYLLDPEDHKTIDKDILEEKIKHLQKEMREVFHLLDV
ncbi:MAG: adenosylmethionine decarboxylase [Oligoflexia bacterium]|nr:adenosylmethionine decarboxylase [Oligoflexia bacterium]